MRLPIIRIVLAAILVAAGWYLLNATRSNHGTLDVPRLSRMADIDGIETEVAITSDGNRVAVIASGDLWVLNPANGERRQITHTAETESFINWTPDSQRITFSRGMNTFAVNPD